MTTSSTSNSKGLPILSSLAPVRPRRTKIVATLGPRTRGAQMIRSLLEGGVNVFRLNFSHGTHDEHLAALNDVRRVSREIGIPCAILQDLSGPKIRISGVVNEVMELRDGDEIELRRSGGDVSSPQAIFVEGVSPADFLSEGEPVYLADGALALVVTGVSGSVVRCSIKKGGRVRSRVGIAFPESTVDLPATTDKDMRDLAWGVEQRVDFVAISFVQSAEDIVRLRSAIADRGGDCRIIAKIERKKALTDIEQIIRAADGIMVARGDLGLELPLEELPLVQREIIERCNNLGKPVIVATQMLHSMISSVRPTRAEVSDIATAVMSSADAVMLSDETAVGEFPLEAVDLLSRVAQGAERTFTFEEYKLRLREEDRETIPDAVAYAACAAAVKLNAGAIIVCTETGSSARLVAKYRPQQRLYGVSTQEAAIRRMCLYWGVTPLLVNPVLSRDEEVAEGIRIVRSREHLVAGTRVVVTGGALTNKPGSTRIMEIRELD